MTSTVPYVEIRHNIEVAHRLSLTPGKCENIHGHSMWVILKLYGSDTGTEGILLNTYGHPFEFGALKSHFRRYLDKSYDHRLLLNKSDPWARELHAFELADHTGTNDATVERQLLGNLPGLVTFDGDPTTENIAKCIAEWAAEQYGADADVVVRETLVNAAAYGAMHKERA